jgi:hypothetical protein
LQQVSFLIATFPHSQFSASWPLETFVSASGARQTSGDRQLAGDVLGMGQAEEEISLWWGVGHGVIDDRAGVIAPRGRADLAVGLKRPTG